MRHFKFRAWDSEAADMFYHRPTEVFKWKEEEQPVIVEQWTGLRDKIGIDIYEGDIINLRFEDGPVPSEVRFQDCRFYLSTLDIVYGNCHDFIIGYDGYEVVGNMHEGVKKIDPNTGTILNHQGFMANSIPIKKA